jgi:hypothetical protein
MDEHPGITAARRGISNLVRHLKSTAQRCRKVSLYAKKRNKNNNKNKKTGEED